MGRWGWRLGGSMVATMVCLVCLVESGDCRSKLMWGGQSPPVHRVMPEAVTICAHLCPSVPLQQAATFLTLRRSLCTLRPHMIQPLPLMYSVATGGPLSSSSVGARGFYPTSTSLARLLTRFSFQLHLHKWALTWIWDDSWGWRQDPRLLLGLQQISSWDLSPETNWS